MRRRSNALLVGALVPGDLQARREKAVAYVKTLDQNKLDTLAKSLGLPTGPDAFDVIAQKLKILFDKEI